MTDRELETRLRQAAELAAPDDLDAILSRCDSRATKGNVIIMEEKKKSFRPRAGLWIAAAACAALILGAAGFGLGAGWQAGNQVASIVSLDVNPSVVLEVNEKEKVLSAQAANADGAAVLDGMDLAGSPLNVAVNAVIGSMVKQGYLDDLANSILITVEDDDTARGQALQQSLTQEVTEALAANAQQGAILAQTVDHSDTALQQKAEEYGITLGKATLIQAMVSQNSQLLFEDLAGLTVNELNLLAANAKNTPTQVVSTGTASDGAYIGVDAAKAAAFAHAGITEADVTGLEVDFDYEKGQMVYELEFWANGVEYEYDVNAATGAIVKFEQENKTASGAQTGTGAQTGSGTQTGNGGQTSTAPVTAEQAQAAAFAHAGVNAADAAVTKCELDRDDGVLRYEIEFWCNNVEYEYDIDATSCAVLKYEQDTHHDDRPASSGTTAGSTFIGYDAARDAALAHAGVTLEQAWELEVDDDLDDHTPKYEVEFKAGGMEYEYEIDAYTGAVLKVEKDHD